MKKTLLALSLISVFPAQAVWWEDANQYRSIASNSHVYVENDQYCEDRALQYAIQASLDDQNFKGGGNKISANVWMHETYVEGPNSAYALVHAQNASSNQYSDLEKHTGSLNAQATLMAEQNLNEDQLVEYATQLSKLDRSGVGVSRQSAPVTPELTTIKDNSNSSSFKHPVKAINNRFPGESDLDYVLRISLLGY